MITLRDSWALQDKYLWTSQGYEFEADGVCMSWETLLHKGYDITKQRLGTAAWQSSGFWSASP